MDAKQATYDVCQCYLRDCTAELGTVLSNRIEGLIRSRSYPELASVSSLYDPEYHGVAVFGHLRQIEALFKKNTSFTDKKVALAAAIESFNTAESQCEGTNLRLDVTFVKHGLWDPLGPNATDLYKVCNKMERWISDCLGDFDTFVSELPAYIRVTNGASATRSRRKSQPHLKVRKRMIAGDGVKPYLEALSQFFGYGIPQIRALRWNRVEFVPKNWKTLRTIACEPDGNLPFQLAFDTYAKGQLCKRGVDLSDQSRNQELARLGSLGTIDLATVDLKSASDTVSFNTVAWLFPEPWFQFLNDIRSPQYQITFPSGNTEVRTYAKFSSMGNGSTFAIESLIFSAACACIGAKEWSVYGDDIIIDSKHYKKLMHVLGFLGFTVNQEKTFVTGPFRESCGKDWYSGIDVTPFYLREWGKRKSSLCHNVNGLARISRPEGYLWEYLRELVKKRGLPLVPYNEQSTSGIWVDIHTAYSLKLFRYKKQCQQFRSYETKSSHEIVADSRTLFLWFLDKNRKRPPDAENTVISSRVPTFSHKYVRKWVSWFPPATGTPDHMYMWSGYITANS